VRARLRTIFEESYRHLRPRAPLPDFHIEFFPFANVNHTIRLRDGQVRARLSDLVEGAPETVLRALAHILLAKLYRHPIEPAHAARYRRHLASRTLVAKAHLVRQMRGRKRLGSARGRIYDLEAVFQRLNQRFFDGLLAQPRLAWSQDLARASLGHYDPAHNAIVISRVLDQGHVPACAVEYLVYHEMLHLKHPVRLRGSRRAVHSREFRAEEKLFPHLGEAQRFLRGL
jgi:predicted metal-dependent hydrolase